MITQAAEVRLTPEDRAVLEARVRAPTTEQRDVFRARIILLADEGRSTRSIARTLGTMPRTVSSWRGRFAREGLAGLRGGRRGGIEQQTTSRTGADIRCRDRSALGGVGSGAAGGVCTLDWGTNCG